MKVEFSGVVEVPDGTPMEDVEEWLQFEIGARASMKGTNALADTDLHTVGVTNVDVRERSW